MEKIDQTFMHITISLVRVARAYRAAADRLAADFNLSQASAWPVIMIGRAGNGVRPGVIAERLSLEPPSLVRIIDQLIDAGLVERREDANDRRAKLLYLTADGRKCARQLEKALIPFRRKLFHNVSKDDIAACQRVLDSLASTMASATQ